ncbi:MAG: alpha/beta hydrolase, partial [Actinomycetota bacterium]|nr:alpha/beta hydrolase [Actinomycetota bacterium]
MLIPAVDEAEPVELPRRPPPALLAAEVPRATVELACMAAMRPLFAAAPRGDGHPVVVLPGFTVGDTSTRYLRHFLRAKGYHVHGWRLGRNLGPTSRIVRGLEDRFAAVSEMHGRKCSVVGWSLGGTFAREIARDHPDAVRQVITLGTPFRLDSIDQLAGGPLFNALSFLYDPTAMSVDDLRAGQARLQVPSTSIYSRTDGFVPWQLCDQGQGA